MGTLANCRSLYNNMLTGTLPEEWSAMKSMQKL
jgi:hypothetical protein